jgi:hypothetical protein
MTHGGPRSFFNLINEFTTTLVTFEELKYVGTFQMLPMSIRVFLVVTLGLIVVGGLRYKWIIIHYLLSPQSSQKIINRFIWIEQILSLLAIFNMFVWILIFLNSKPLSEVLGNWICIAYRYAANFRQSGLVIWSCMISVYRVACLRAQWIVRVNDRMIWALMFAFGSTINILATIVLSEFVEGSVKSCQFSKVLENEIFLEYKVSHY